MLVDKTVKVEAEVDTIASELVTVAQKVKAGEAVTQILSEEIGKLVTVISAAIALPGDIGQSVNGTLRAAFINLADGLCVLLGQKVEA